MHTRSDQKKEGKKRMPIIVVKNIKTLMMMAKVAPSKGVHD